GAVGIEQALHQFLHGLLGLLPRLGKDGLDGGLTDHLAHGAFGHLLHRHLGVLDVEEVVARVLDAPEDDEVDIDDVLIAGQNQAFLRYVANATAKAARAAARAHADLDDALLRHLGQAHLFDRIGKPEVQPRRLRPRRLTEEHNDAEFIGVDAKRKGIKGQYRCRHHGDQKHQRSRQARATGHHLLQLVLATLQDFFEVGLMMGTPARGALTPRSAAPASSAAPTATLVAPRHRACLYRSPLGLSLGCPFRQFDRNRPLPLPSVARKSACWSLIGHTPTARKSGPRLVPYGVCGLLEPTAGKINFSYAPAR